LDQVKVAPFNGRSIKFWALIMSLNSSISSTLPPPLFLSLCDL
jgi:hypothetical protein